MSTNEPVNPYAVHEPAPNGAIIDQTIVDDTTRYAFHGELRRSDVQRFFRRFDTAWALFALAALMTCILIFGFLWQDYRALGTTVCMFLMVIVLGIWWAVWGQGNAFVRRTPQALGELHGFVSPHRLVVHRRQASSEYLLNALVEATVVGDCFLLGFDVHRIAQVLLPLELFAEEDRPAVQSLLMTRGAHSPIVEPMVLDRRLIDNAPLPIENIPDGAVRYAGEVLGSDLLNTPLEVAMHRQHLALALWLLVGFALMIVPLVSSDLWQPELMLGVPIGVGMVLGLLFTIKRLWKLRDPEQCWFNVAGWVTSEQLHAVVATCSSTYRWSAFTNLAITDRAIALQLPGHPQRHVIVAKRTFPTDDAWEEACQLVRAGMQRQAEQVDAA